MGKLEPVQRTTKERKSCKEGRTEGSCRRRGDNRGRPKVALSLEDSSRRVITLQLNHWFSIAGVIAVGWLHLLVIKTARVHSG